MVARAARGKRAAGDHRLSFRAAKGRGIAGAVGDMLLLPWEKYGKMMFSYDLMRFKGTYNGDK
jgi:hypothetical protein